ncbi:3'-5' exoribonuclease [Sphingomicrobium marinum]|uniref:3'-5' exoribonuclease n=1 Tax=Sphingomicrobium marinum TaxID=1227950 RepID=UPI0022406D93|nr:3'-5' exoribonuclease [Sphingomicrobium marinum]
MRYFLDTEFDGFGGALLSLALVPEDGGEEFYAIIKHDVITDPWVERNVLPYLNTVPEALKELPLSRSDAAHALAAYLAHDDEPLIVADWPEDLAQFSMLLLVGPGRMVTIPPFTLQMIDLSGFSTAANSEVPHNALHDARSLRDHVINHLE